MRNPTLHAILEAFAADAAATLGAAADDGAEVPFELVAEPGPGALFYCYRPLTGRFIEERRRLLSTLSTYAPAVRALAGLDDTADYLRARGVVRVPSDPRSRAETALGELLARIHAERSRFGFERDRFEAAYAELELALFDGRRTATIIAPVVGLALDHATHELALGEGLTLVRGDRLPEAPAQAVWAADHRPPVLAVFTATRNRQEGSSVPAARSAFRRLLTTLRLFERGGFAIGPLAWARDGDGEWRAVALGGGARAAQLPPLSAAPEDELRAFHSLLARRLPAAGELPWALARYEMGCERLRVAEALSDYLLALRALLEPEGPGSGRLAGRLAALCATADQRAAVTARVTRAIALEREIVTSAAAGAPADAAGPSGGTAGRGGGEALVLELAEHLRAVLRDLLGGHLPADVCGLADDVLAEDGATPPAGVAVSAHRYPE